MKLEKQYTNRSDFWNTPSDLYYKIISKGFIDYNLSNSMLIPFNINTKLFYKDKVFINPPFSILSNIEFLNTIDELLSNKCIVLLLIPARTDTKYFHYLINKYEPIIVFQKGRLKFNDSKNSAPFPSIFLYFDKDSNKSIYIDDIKYILSF